jgi:hypothetical protein
MTMQPWSAQPPAAYTQPIVDYQNRAVTRLAEWVQSADAAFNVATRLVESSFVPAQFRGKAVEATAAILAGTEVGLSPMAALRAFDIIQGQAAPKAITLRAIVQSHGHDMVLIESTATRCRMKGRRRGADDWQAVTWTIDRAKDLGLTSKDQWKKQPGTMLVARATGELARLVASDAILGIGYSSEEISDGAGPTDFTDEPEAPTPTRRMSRKTVAPPVTPDEGEEPQDAEVMIHAEPDEAEENAKRIRRMFALFTERGFKDASHPDGRQGRIDYIVEAVGHPITSSSDLSAAEVGTVIDMLEADGRDPWAGQEPTDA